MHTSRLSTRRPAIFFAAAVFAATALVASGTKASSSPTETSHPSLNRMEHQAHRYLAEAQQEQSRASNRREHQAHLSEIRQEEALQRLAPAGSQHEHQAHRHTKKVAPARRTVVLRTRTNQCALVLAEAWRNRLYFSDAYETYLLRQPPCSPLPANPTKVGTGDLFPGSAGSPPQAGTRQQRP